MAGPVCRSSKHIASEKAGRANQELNSDTRSLCQSRCHYARIEARKMLETRAASKVRSQQLWVAEHTPKVALAM